MVYGPGGYRLRDYVKLGGLITLLAISTVTIMVPLVYGI
jgi:di/tricarboxylate transporter